MNVQKWNRHNHGSTLSRRAQQREPRRRIHVPQHQRRVLAAKANEERVERGEHLPFIGLSSCGRRDGKGRSDQREGEQPDAAQHYGRLAALLSLTGRNSEVVR